jgi:membrane-bound lytic murein transglycosylase D
MHPPPMRIGFIFSVFWFMLQLSATSAAAYFPTHDVIRPNVAFWIKIYTEYTTSQSIVHDSEDLTIIYDVIDLKPYGSPSASKINRMRMKRVKAKYERILKRLATDPGTGDPACRRVAQLFGPQATAKTFQAARARVRCQVGQSDRFKAGLIRSGAYIDKIRAIFRAEHLPEELAYLPHVESSFNTKAYSKFGAAGVWQFTRSTGTRFMKVGYVLDERRDPILATHAAAGLLKENFQKLASWPLAITAYNHGAAGMARAKQSFGDYPAIFASYRSRTFKFASRNFYPEFLAACEVAQNYQAYFGDLQMDRPAQFQVVTLGGYVAFEQLCDLFKVPAHVAQALNPALRPPVFNGQKLVPQGYPFRLPAELIVAAVPVDMYQGAQKPSRFYTVQRGDTAGRVARTQGVKLVDLVLANNLDRNARIYPKQTLRMPLPGESLPHTPAAPPSNPREPELLAKNEISTPVVREPLSKNSTDSQPILDSIDSTAAPDAVSESEPLSKNSADSQPVLASIDSTVAPDAVPEAEDTVATGNGQSLSMEVVAADVRFEKVIGNARKTTGIIQAEVEETLGHYAEWAGVRTQRIRRLNGLAFGRTLHLHQKIKIPLTRTTVREFEESRYEFHKRLQEDFFSAYRVSDLQTYRVMRGDNLWSLCLEKFEIPMWLLKNCNPEVDFAALHLQQKLMVPTIEKSGVDGSTPSAEPESDNAQIPAAPLQRASL